MGYIPKKPLKQVGGGLKNVMVTHIVPSHHAPIPEQRVSMDSRHPLTKQWHRRQGADGRKITSVE